MSKNGNALSHFINWKGSIQRQLGRQIFEIKKRKEGYSEEEIREMIREERYMTDVHRLNKYMNRVDVTIGFARLVGEAFNIDYRLLLPKPGYYTEDVTYSKDMKVLFKLNFGIDLDQFALTDCVSPNTIPADSGNIFYNENGFMYIKKRAAKQIGMKPRQRYRVEVTDNGTKLHFIKDPEGTAAATSTYKEEAGKSYSAFSFYVKKYLNQANIEVDPERVAASKTENGYIFDLFY